MSGAVLVKLLVDKGPLADMLNALQRSGLYGADIAEVAETLMLDQLKHLVGIPAFAEMFREEEARPVTLVDDRQPCSCDDDYCSLAEGYLIPAPKYCRRERAKRQPEIEPQHT